MAIFKFPALASIHTITDFDHAFDLDSSGADTLSLGFGYFFVAEGFGAVGAFLSNTGAWTVTVNGSIVSATTTGLWLLGGNPQVSTITIGSEGTVGGAAGVTLDSSAILKNAGEISATEFGIHIRNAGTRSIVNSGSITGLTNAIYDENDLSNDTLQNSGTITGTIDLGGGNNRLTNSGQVTLNVLFDTGGNNSVTNSGQIGGNVAFAGGGGNNSLTNSGQIGGSVSFGPATNKLTNLGTIGNIAGDSGQDTVVNSGTVAGPVTLASGNDTLKNSGTIAGMIDLGSDDDTFINFKKIGTKTIAGTVTGQIFLGTGNDSFIGGNKSEHVLDVQGSDSYKLAGGNDKTSMPTQKSPGIRISPSLVPTWISAVLVSCGPIGIRKARLSRLTLTETRWPISRSRFWIQITPWFCKTRTSSSRNDRFSHYSGG